MIVEKIDILKRSRIKQWPCNTNRASSLGHECLRYLVFERTRWHDKVLHGVGLQRIFDEGNLHETAVIRDIMDAGLQVIEQQRAFEWREYLITGHIDLKVLVDGFAAPTEIKSCSPYVFATLTDAKGLANSKYPHIRRYPAQLTLYCLMDNKEWGLFIFKNKQTGELKEIRIDLDYEFGESLIKKAEAINEHVKAGTIPEPIPYDPYSCDGCGYFHICLPEVKRSALELETDPELEAKLKRIGELKPLKSEYELLDKEVKEYFKEKEKIVIGNFLITGKWVERKGFTVESGKYWKVNIKSLEA